MKILTLTYEYKVWFLLRQIEKNNVIRKQNTEIYK